MLWSGLAAGLSMGFSLVAPGLLRNIIGDVALVAAISHAQVVADEESVDA